VQNRPDLAELVEKAGEGSTMGSLDRTRYQLLAPAEGLQASDADWSTSLRNAEAQLMHSDARLTNLELLKKYGGECHHQDGLLLEAVSEINKFSGCYLPHSKSLATAQFPAGSLLATLSKWCNGDSKRHDIIEQNSKADANGSW
jgi:hypothetical protein